MMGFEFIWRWQETSEGVVSLDADGGFDIAGYERMAQLLMFAPDSAAEELPGTGVSYRFTGGMDTITFNAAPSGDELFRIDMRKHAEGLTKELAASSTGRIPAGKMAVTGAGSGLRVRLCPWLIRVRREGGEVRVEGVRGVILYSIEKAM
jgi:hypothetical protein